ncbi:MAG: hypothetical protein U9N07_00500, partial [Euryarchaeota archaeon]|nr:hypothetical protein [Euryarchaeota archaeon]
LARSDARLVIASVADSSIRFSREDVIVIIEFIYSLIKLCLNGTRRVKTIPDTGTLRTGSHKQKK